MRHININLDRYLHSRDGIYQYRRRVPSRLADLDDRGPIIRLSLGTDDILTAREKRNAFERADNEYWAALISGDTPPGDAMARYRDRVRRAESLGFTYRTAAEIATLPLDEIVQRVAAVMNEATPKPVVQAILGTIDRPQVTFTQILELTETEIKRTELRTKSVRQRRRWKAKIEWAIASFHEVVGVVDVGSITRSMATQFKKHWAKRIAPDPDELTAGIKPMSASTGNRAIGLLRGLYRDYYEHLGEQDRPNPFDGLSFGEKKGGKAKRPPFHTEWISQKFLHGTALSRMNEEARGILLAMVETGARPAELCNLSEKEIILNEPVPHLIIRPSLDLDDPFELKSEASEREIPLVGVALEVFKKFPKGFPRYRDNSNSFSAATNSYLKENNLLETDKHVVYSLRHSFEDRMKTASIDGEVRQIIFGHKLNRPRYGVGGGLGFWHKSLSGMALAFDPKVV